MSASQSVFANRGESVAPATDDEILELNTGASITRASGTKATDAAAQSKQGRAGENATSASGRDGAQVQNSSDSTDRGDSAESDAKADSNVATETPENYREIFEANPELRDAWNVAKSYREVFPDIEQARAVQKLFPTAGDAQRAAAEIVELERIDSLFLSNRPEALAELAAVVYRLNPESFENLARVMTGMVRSSAAATAPAETSAPASQVQATTGRNGSPDESRQAFLAATNAIAVQGVIEAIESQVDRLLPEGIAPGVRNRVVGEIYRELDAALANNRGLSRQLREALGAGPADAERQRGVAGVLVGRARQALPGVAKKVIGEWTSSVLAASSERLARQRAGERRIDIANAGPAASEVRRPLSPNDINYTRLSDADILNL